MIKSEFSSIKNTTLSLKPSSAIRLLLMVLFVSLFANAVSAQTTLFQFNFENNINPNVDNVIGVPSFTSNGVTNQGYITTTPCGGARMYTAENWDTGNYYRFAVNTTGFSNLTFSFCNRTDNTSIGTFLVRVSSDSGTSWTTVLATYTPTVLNNTLTTVTFPTTANNAAIVWIEISKVSNGANNARTLLIDSATLTGYPIPTISSFTPTSGCSNSTSVVITGTNFTGVTGVRFGGTNAASYVVNSSTQITAVPAAGSSGAINIVTSGGIATGAESFVVNSTPTVISSASLTTVCSGGNVTLTASVITPTTQNTVLFSEGFNGGTNTWTKINTSTGGTPANADWTLRSNGYVYNYPGYPVNTFNSNDNSQFYLSNSAAQGGGTTSTILQSPAISTVGYTSLSLEFYQYNLDFDGTDFARVEVSTNGSSWTTLTTTTTTQGAENDFLKTTVNLNSYINNTTLYIRFKYDAQFDWFWAIDNITVSGNKTIPYTFSWTALPSATAGLPVGAGTASTTNNSFVANPTANTAYTVTATNPTTGCSSTSIVNVTVNSSNTWTGVTSTSWFIPTNWSCGNLPTSGSDVTIPDVTNKPIVDGTNTTALANTITVASGSSLTVNSSNTLKVTDKLTNNIGGTITFEDSASLVQINNVANTGTINYKRNYTGGEMDYTYWSSPVASQNLLALSPATKQDKFLSFNGTDWVQENPSTTTMTVGKGYIIRGVPPPLGPPVGFDTLIFNGVPNNGTKTIAVAGGASSNLIGNPYPSAIYADQFLFDNQAVIDGTIYFWTHNTPIAVGTPDPGTGAWAYSGNDYASYSLTGGVGTGSGIGNTIPGTPPSENISNRPTGKIAAGQSFFTTSTVAGGTVSFTNAMRVDGLGNPLNNSNFYKTKNPKVKTAITIEKHRVWLNLTNAQGAFKQTLVGYITGATNTWDKMYDGESFDGNDFLDFYSINENMNLTIQGRALPFDDNDEVPLGYRIAIEGDFTINIDETDGLLANQDVYLEDKLTNKTVNLKEGKYTFNTTAGTFDNRFVLRYTNKTLGTNDVDSQMNQVLVSVKNKQIKVNSFGETIDKVAIYDLLGRKLYQKDKINSNEFLITDFKASQETLLVKTSLQNGKVVSEKIIF